VCWTALRTATRSSFVNGRKRRQITGRVILKKFGLPESYLSRLEKWAYAFNKGLGAIQPSAETLDLVEEIVVEMQGRIHNRDHAPAALLLPTIFYRN